ncbi:MAG TPA: hypothetical protein VGR07_15630 [Thermoanaerobaculia bacterium]|jgi:hypothetical protein|nr:hypothetical protein [Thermoanaerobaculia bacterium]
MTEAIREGDIPGVQLRCRQPLPIPPAEAWAWLVEAEKLGLWLADEAAVEPGPQGSLVLVTRGEGPGRRERGKTLVWAPPRQWVLAFEHLDAGWTAPTRLTLAVHPHSDAAHASEVDVLQHGFQRLPLSLGLTVWEAYRRRWRTALARLAAAAAP